MSTMRALSLELVKFLTWLLLILMSFSCATPDEKQIVSSKQLCTTLVCRNLTWTDKFKHCGTFIYECDNYSEASIINQYSLQGFAFQYDPENSGSSTYKADREAFLNRQKTDVTHQLIPTPTGMSPMEFVELIRSNAKTYRAVAYWPYGPNSNSAADFPLFKSGAKTEKIDGALGLHHYHKDSELDEIKNSAVKLFYEYASSKSKTLIEQIKNQTIKQGAFKNLTIGDNKESVINSLRELQAVYVTTDNHSDDGMIDLRNKNNIEYQSRLHTSNQWNVTYDDDGQTFWFLQLKFDQQRLKEIYAKSSGLELP
jgi:hypothetical protein